MSQFPSQEDPDPKSSNNLFDLAQGSDWKVSLSNENPQDRDYRLQQDSLVPMGVVSFGLVSMGVLSTGIMSMGLVSLGMHSMSIVQIDTSKVMPQEKSDTEIPLDRNMSH
jgi:hypothetical protein